MPQRPKGSPAPRPRPRIYLMAGPAISADLLTQALSAPGADIAAVLAAAPGAEGLSALEASLHAAQAHDAAFLVGGDPDLAARLGADGAHLTGIDALRNALPRLRPGRIAGVGGLTSRHDAMLAGELGADYVLFGEPDEAGYRPAFAAIVERVEWWSEIFEPPCVAFAADLDELTAVASAGADFVALADLVWNHARGAAEALSEAAERLRALEFA